MSVAWKQEPWYLLIGVLSVLTSLTRYQDLQIIFIHHNFCLLSKICEVYCILNNIKTNEFDGVAEPEIIILLIKCNIILQV